MSKFKVGDRVRVVTKTNGIIRKFSSDDYKIDLDVPIGMEFTVIKYDDKIDIVYLNDGYMTGVPSDLELVDDTMKCPKTVKEPDWKKEFEILHRIYDTLEAESKMLRETIKKLTRLL